ncbi:MAG: iron chaperone [Actinomycetota bacterium]
MTDDDATTGQGAAEVDAFLAALPDDQRKALGDLRTVIRAAAPTATEGLGYGVPAFKLNGRPFVSYGAGKAHCAFYVQSPGVMEAHAADLEGYELGKGSIRFQPEAPLPDALVRTLVEARIAELGVP